MSSHFCCARCARTTPVEDDSHPPPRCPACGADAVETPQPQTREAEAWWITEAKPAPSAIQTTADSWGAAPLPDATPAPSSDATPLHVRLALLAAGGCALLVFACALAVMALPSRKSSAPQPTAATPPMEQPESTEQPSTPQEPPAPLREPQPPNPPVRVEQQPERKKLPQGKDFDGRPAEQPKARTEEPKVEKLELRKPCEVIVKRRTETDADDLVKQLAKVPELRLDASTTRRLESEQLIALARKPHSDDAAVEVMEKRADLAGLPWLKGDACKISPTAADNLEEGSLALRTFMSDVNAARGGGGGGRPNPKVLDEQLNKSGRDHNRWLKTEAIPALQQLLMAEDDAIREVLVDQLARIEGKKAAVALAQRALFDLHPRVRQRALNQLAKRPVGEYRDVLLAGFSYPWPVVAENAAEAVIALQMTDVVGPLLATLDAPDPLAPYTRDGKKGMMVKEMVRVNHLLNCVMCHAVATKQTDKVRGRVPTTLQPLPPAFSRQYYADTSGTFVRANVTYLRQDFSVPLKVAKPDKWPEVQRYDFLVRERPATVDDVIAAAKRTKGATKHQQSIFFALRELTGADPGPTAEDWKKHFLTKDLKAKAVHVGLKNPHGVAVRSGTLYVSEGDNLLRRKEGDEKLTTWLKDTGGVEALTAGGKGGLLAINATSRTVGTVDPSSQELAFTPLSKDKRLHSPARIVSDRNGGAYVSDEPNRSDVGDNGSVWYVSAHGSLTKLPVDLPWPRGVALANDGKTLYVGSAGSPDVMAYPVESAGSIGKGKRLARVGTSWTADLAVDGKGNVCVLDAGGVSVEIISSGGARVGLAKLPDVPVACAAENSTLFVLTKKGVYGIDLSRVDPRRVTAR